jgi:hypothetical protein
LQNVVLSSAYTISWENLKLVQLQITWLHPARNLAKYGHFVTWGRQNDCLSLQWVTKSRKRAKLYDYYNILACGIEIGHKTIEFMLLHFPESIIKL